MCETRCDNADMKNVGEKMENIGFNIVYKNRYEVSRFKSGGLIVAVKKDVCFKWKKMNNNYETLLSIELDKRNLYLDKDLIISAVYIPPSHSRYAKPDHFDELDNLLLNHTDSFHLLCGDFNAHTGTMTDVVQVEDDNIDDYYVVRDVCTVVDTLGITRTRFNKDVTQDRSSYGKKLLDVCKNNQVLIMNGRMGLDYGVGAVTTTYETTVDYIIGSPLLMQHVKQFKVLEYDPLYSDVHMGLHIQLKFECRVAEENVSSGNINNNVEECDGSIRPGRWNLDKSCEYENNIDVPRVNDIIGKIDELTVNEISEELKNILIEPAIKVFPPPKNIKYVKKSNGVSMNGYDFKSWKCRKEYHKAKRKHYVCKSRTNYDNMINKSKTYKKALKRVNNKANADLIKKLRENKSKDPQSYWKILRGRKKSDRIPIELDKCYDHFKSLASEGEGNVNGNRDIMYEVNIDDPTPTLNKPITHDEVNRCIKHLNNNKSPGNDMIINEYIRYTSHILSPLYVKLFNKILDTGCFPEEWLIGTIVPIYKNKGDVKDVNNYRGITLLSCMGKLFTSVLNERLKEYAHENNILSESQAGFRSEYSTVDHIFLLKCVIDLFNWKKKKLFCLFVDYTKAFDMVWRDGLWYKLVKENVDGKILNVIRNMYCNIKSRVMVEQQHSDSFICHMGVRQGENLSPLLFAFYVNDIETKLLEHNCNYLNFNDDFLNDYLKLFVLMYADDTVVLCDSEQGMKQALVALNTYCSDWKLKINCSKTKIVVFSRGKIQADKYNFTFDRDSIEVVSHYKYLGITFNYNGRFRKGELELKEQAQRAMYSIIGTCRKFDLPVDIQIEMFNSMVLPVMTYASEIWGHYIIRDMEILQMKYFKQVLCVHKKTSTDIVYGELGVYPVEIHIKCRVICFWVRILLGSKSKLSYLMYKCLFLLDAAGIYSSPWITFVKNICNDCGMSGVWITQYVDNPVWFKKAVERRLKDQWITTWHSNLVNKSICSSYNIYKEVYDMEEYLVKLSKGNRIMVSKLRTGNNKFPIITGRYQEINREDRICSKCNANVVGDEYHVLFTCQNADIVRLRNKFIPSYYINRPTHFKYVILMQSKNVNLLTKLAQFLRAIFGIFR